MVECLEHYLFQVGHSHIKYDNDYLEMLVSMMESNLKF